MTYQHGFRAHQCFSGSAIISASANLSVRSVENLNLLGIFEYHFQAILRVVFDEAGDFNLAVLELLRRLFVFFEKLHCRVEDNSRQSLG